MQSNSIKECIPNALSILRMLLTVLFAFLIFKSKFLLGEIVFVLAAFTDFFDGFLARKWNATSQLGAIIDPLADKFLMTVSYLVFFNAKLIPSCVCAIVVGRDVLIVSVVLLCKALNIKLEMAPLESSKINTATQLMYIIFIIACNSIFMHVPLTWELSVSSIIVCMSTIISGIHYIVKYRWIKDAVCKNMR